MPKSAARIAFAALAVSAATAAAQSPGFSWRREAGATALVCRDQIVWQFQHASTQPKTMFHPVSLPDGPVLSWDQPPDHRWHHAFWFAWKYINGLNYWEEGRTREPEGVTALRAVKITTRPDYSAQIAVEIDYHPPDQPPVLRESRTIEVSAPDRNGRYPGPHAYRRGAARRQLGRVRRSFLALCQGPHRLAGRLQQR
jgi:hypothetical protein